ncbi:MAG TPA: AAA-associated domain-containing protein, partial [Candidatus Aquilonibacter sp.]
CAIDLPRPHDRNSQLFKDLVDHLYQVMTNPEADVATTTAVAAPGAPSKPSSPFSKALPHVRIGSVSGLLELLAEETSTSQDVADIAEGLAVTVDDLLSVLEAATLLDFVKVSGGEVALTAGGRDFATANILRSKEIFREQLLARVPLFKAIVKTLSMRKNREMPADFFLDLWDEYFPEEAVQRQLATTVDWGRYAELFEYDTMTQVFTLHEEAPEEIGATA